eukprot:gene7803-9154_t
MDLCFTATAYTQHHDNRVAFLCRSIANLRALITKYLDQNPAVVAQDENIIQYSVSTKKLGFLVPCEGKYPLGAGKDFWLHHPVYQSKLKECDEIVRKYAQWSPLELIYTNPVDLTLVEDKRYVCVTIVQICIASVYESYGVEPSFLLPYCGGQFAAHAISGLTSLEEELMFIMGYAVASRDKFEHTGAMGVINYGKKDLSVIIEDLGLDNHLYIVEASTSVHCLVSGDHYAFMRLLKELKVLNITYSYNQQNTIAWHCDLVESTFSDLEFYKQTMLSPKAAIYGPGRIIDQSNYKSVDTRILWSSLLSCPVKFDQDVRTVLRVEKDCDAYLEISTYPIVSAILKRNLFEKGKPKHLVVQSMHHGTENNLDTLMATLTKLSVGLYPVCWEVAYPHSNHTLLQDYLIATTTC